MSETRNPPAVDTTVIPSGTPAGETVEAATAAATVGAAAPSMSPTMDVSPGPPRTEHPATVVGQSPSMEGTLPDRRADPGETLDEPRRADTTLAGGASVTDPGSRAGFDLDLDATEDPDRTEAPTTEPGGGASARRRPRAAGVEVPGYEIIAEIGRGGMGVVYKARHVRLNRLVALKMILAGAHASDDQIARFHIEARAVAQIQHEGIVQIHEDGDHDGLPYFSLEFVPGGSLHQLIGGKPQPPRAAASMVMALGRAMAEAHSKGIIHRDLKPANVLLTLDGKPKITDFGLAKQMEADSKQTRSGAIMGTPSYMAPEQAWGQTHEIGPLSDQYALGAILYEMLVGRPPFQGATALETLELARTQEPVPPTRLQPKLPTDLETICLKALQKDPARRFADAAAMAEDLRRFLDGEPIVARPVAAPERFWRWCKRNPRVAALAGVIALMGIGITVGSAAFASSLRKLNGELTNAYTKEESARKTAQANELAAIQARNEAIAATKGAFAQNRNALEAQRVLSVLLNQRLLSIPGTQGIREELINTTLTGLEATMASLEGLGTVAPDREGNALALRTLAGINQRAGLIAMEYGKYDETARYFRRMEELAEKLAAADPGAVEPIKVKGSVKATVGDFELDRIGDAEAALRHYEEALALRRDWLAREPSNDEAKRGVANMLGALARARLQLGAPAKARDLYREEIALREQLSPSLAGQVEVRRERAGLEDKLGDLEVSLGDPAAGRAHFERALRLRREIAAENPGETQAQRDVLLSLEKLGNDALIARRDARAALAPYREALDGFVARLKLEPSSVQARMDVALAHYYVATAELRAGDPKAAASHYRACRDIREELAKDPKTKISTLDLMLDLARTGDHAGASEIAEAMIKEPPLDARVYFQAACGFALSAGAVADSGPSDASARQARHYTDRAFDALRLALKRGWRSADQVATDPDLDPIRADPRFATLLEDFRKAGP
ncbi:serine/threonine-protein kinase [Aquisphaera insulae]|uniref:serine/threonine-protein kinase n=1 Tax=Aquisphaera insulae TaxID=2712864 RepID=UPI0020300537|nr:serine/threonine-protein kinase [Aquisphaera insulae]